MSVRLKFIKFCFANIAKICTTFITRHFVTPIPLLNHILTCWTPFRYSFQKSFLAKCLSSCKKFLFCIFKCFCSLFTHFTVLTLSQKFFCIINLCHFTSTHWMISLETFGTKLVITIYAFCMTQLGIYFSKALTPFVRTPCNVFHTFYSLIDAKSFIFFFDLLRYTNNFSSPLSDATCAQLIGGLTKCRAIDFVELPIFDLQCDCVSNTCFTKNVLASSKCINFINFFESFITNFTCHSVLLN